MFDSSRVESSTGRWSIPIDLFLGSLLLVAATLKDYGITWDEPAYFHASDLQNQWLVEFGENLLRSDLGKSLQDENIKKAWHWDPYHVPHPPFSRIVSGITKATFAPYVDKFVAYRLGPALFFALLVTCIYVWMRDLFDEATGLFSALALLVIPNLFGFAHIAVTDIALAAMWFFTVYCFSRGLDNWRWSIVLGLVWGLALATKFPALMLPVPLLLWAHLYLRADYRNNLFSMIFLGPLVAVASQDDGVGLDADRSELRHRMLCRLGLQLAPCGQVGNEGDVDEEAVVAADVVSALENSTPPYDPGAPFYQVEMYDQTLPFYLKRTTTLVDYRDELALGLDAEPERGIAKLTDWEVRWRALPQAYALMTPDTFDKVARLGVPLRVVARDPRRVLVARQ